MFWKEYGKTVKRLWLNQFGGVAFGLMLSFLASAMMRTMPQNDRVISYVSGVLGMFFYCYLLYIVIWEVGAKDRIKVDGERLSPRPHFGLKIALVYSIPSFAVTFLYAVAAFLYNIAGISNAVVRGAVNVLGMLSLILEAPYAGFAIGIFGDIGKRLAETMLFPYALFWIATCIPAAITIWGGYYFGYRGLLMSRVYRQKKQ
jgi:hypothetical protein